MSCRRKAILEEVGLRAGAVQVDALSRVDFPDTGVRVEADGRLRWKEAP